METQCSPIDLDLPRLGRHEIRADFGGGDITSDGGALLLRKTEQLTGIIRQFAACFTDHRNPDLIEDSVEELVAQRVYGLALGYEDLNDHDDLRRDPLLAAVVGKADPTGQARQAFEATKQPARVFAELRYRTLDSWSRERRVVAKSEHLTKGANPHFVVTWLSIADRPARPLYEEDYCGRVEAENRIKEQQLHLFADRTSAQTMRANQIRLFSSSIAYVLLNALRRLGLEGTESAAAQCQTIRLKRLKIAALVQVTVRKVWVHLASSCPYAAVFRRVHAHLSRRPPLILRR